MFLRMVGEYGPWSYISAMLVFICFFFVMDFILKIADYNFEVDEDVGKFQEVLFLQTKSITKKQMNQCMAAMCRVWMGYKP